MNRRRARGALPFLAALALGACAAWSSSALSAPASERPASTYERVAEAAEAGDPASRNVLGFMLLFGEAAPYAPHEARRWFEAAAASGDPAATMNLALMYALGVSVERNPLRADRIFHSLDSVFGGAPPFGSLPHMVEEACRPPRGLEEPGALAFGQFCSGCHGLNGIASYGGAPSFALGERMEKSQAELFATVMGGHGDMPAWGEILPREMLAEALRHVRRLPQEFRGGLIHVLREEPDRFFRFGPMSSDFWNRPTEPSLRFGSGTLRLEEYCSSYVTAVRAPPPGGVPGRP